MVENVSSANNQAEAVVSRENFVQFLINRDFRENYREDIMWFHKSYGYIIANADNVRHMVVSEG
jgi:hypothetical protein